MLVSATPVAPTRSLGHSMDRAAMKALVLLHRWLGIGFCLLFAMWFASGIVMHFVPFPSLDEDARFAGLLPIDLSQVRHGPDEAAIASNKEQVRRVRLLQRMDGPVYITSGGSGLVAVHATDLSDASVKSEQLALDIAQAHARRRGIDAAHATLDGVADYDQWSVPNGFDHHRPLYRVALNDVAGTELYVSSTTGEVVLATTRNERVWNYLGSVAHWIYPTRLRKTRRPGAKRCGRCRLMALIAAVAGAVLGVARLRLSQGATGFAVPRLARLASHPRPAHRDLCADMDFQRLAVDGRWPAVFARPVVAGGSGEGGGKRRLAQSRGRPSLSRRQPGRWNGLRWAINSTGANEPDLRFSIDLRARFRVGKSRRHIRS